MIMTMMMMITIIISSSSSSSSSIGIIFSFYGFVKLLLMQSLQSCFPRAATALHHILSFGKRNINLLFLW